MTSDPTIPPLQQQINQRESGEGARFGTFQGVFCPTLLTILGVIMFLRLGWVVGHAGLLGAWSIILLASAITLCTALSISTVTTNIRIGSGGAFSIISQSLGLEVGGAVGTPLYLCQALAVAMYIFGFRAGWLNLFPAHSPLAVDLCTFACLLLISLLSADVAFKVQYLLLAILAGSLVSILATLGTAPTLSPQWFSANTSEGGYWGLFAVFFPAVTGIMAGLNMSGELKDPRRSIPRGTLWAIAVSTLIYMGLALWCAVTVAPEELIGNYMVMLERAMWPWAVTAGLLGATFSSGLSSLVGAPRILQALGEHNVVPGGKWLAHKTSRGEPRNAVLLTGAIVLGALFLRDLNVIASLLTMFFLIAYGTLNLVTLIEQKLALSSFRPLLKIHHAIPFLGALGCLFAMLVVNPISSVVALVLVASFYGMLLGRNLRTPQGDVRSGMFVSVAEWAAKKVAHLPGSQRAWRPSLLVPVSSVSELRGEFAFLKALAYPQGTLKLVGVAADGPPREEMEQHLPELASAFQQSGVYTAWTILQGESFTDPVITAMQALGGAFFKPNILFLALPPTGKQDPELQRLVSSARSCGLGVLLLWEHPRSHLGCSQAINVWVRDQTPEWNLSMDLGNKDMTLLTAYLLNTAWQGKIRLLSSIADESQRTAATAYLEQLLELARLPEVEVEVLVGQFPETLAQAPSADLNLFGFGDPVSLAFVRRIVGALDTTCVFARDSGSENVLA